MAANTLPAIPLPSQSAATSVSVPIQAKGHGKKTQSGRELSRRRGKKQVVMSPPVPDGPVGPDAKANMLTNSTTPTKNQQTQINDSKTPNHHFQLPVNTTSLSSPPSNLLQPSKIHTQF